MRWWNVQLNSHYKISRNRFSEHERLHCNSSGKNIYFWWQKMKERKENRFHHYFISVFRFHSFKKHTQSRCTNIHIIHLSVLLQKMLFRFFSFFMFFVWVLLDPSWAIIITLWVSRECFFFLLQFCNNFFLIALYRKMEVGVCGLVMWTLFKNKYRSNKMRKFIL